MEDRRRRTDFRGWRSGSGGQISGVIKLFVTCYSMRKEGRAAPLVGDGCPDEMRPPDSPVRLALHGRRAGLSESDGGQAVLLLA